MALLHRQLGRRHSSHIPLVENVDRASLQKDGAGLPVPLDGCPVEGRTSFLVRGRVPCIEDKEEADGVCKALVSGPVDRSPPVVVGGVNVHPPL